MLPTGQPVEGVAHEREEEEEVAYMRRIIAVLSVMAIVAAMIAASAVPAFVKGGGGATVHKCSEFQGAGVKGKIVSTPSGHTNSNCRHTQQRVAE